MQMTQKMPRILVFIFALVSASASIADVLDDTLKRGTLRVGVAEFAPWTTKTSGGELIGFEIDLSNKMAEDMGVKAEFKLMDWEKLIPALLRGEIDIISGGMSITPARALKVNFSDPIAKSGIGLATNTGLTKEFTSLQELNDPNVRISTVAETLALTVAQRLFERANLVIHPTAELAEKDVLEGSAHAYMATTPETTFLALRNEAKIDLPLTEPLLASVEALAVKKGEQEFLNFINAWVTARQADEWLTAKRDYWFNTLEWTKEVSK